MNKHIIGIFVLSILTIGTLSFSNWNVTAAEASSNSTQTTTRQSEALSEQVQQQQESEQAAQEERQGLIPNHPPRANAGSDKKVNEGANIILDARRSSDPNAGDKVSYLWRQISGPAIALENNSASVVSFTAPEVTRDRSISFVLIVRDEKGAQGTDSIKVSIKNVETTTDTTDNNNIGTVQENDNTNTNTNTNTDTTNNRNPTTTTTTNPPGLENTTSNALTNAQNALRNNGSRAIIPSPAETQMSRSAAFTPFAISTAVSAVQADNIVNTRTAYDIIFRTASAGAIKTVEMTFPQGTNIGSATMLEVSGIGQGGTSVGGPNGLTLIYTVANPVNVPTNVFLRFEVWKILNPPTLGTYTVQVVTKDSNGNEIDSGTSATYQIKQITTNDIADNAILSAKIGDGQVGTADIAGNSITSAKILDGEVKTTDIADSAITSAKIQDGQVGTAELADNSVTTSQFGSKLADNAVTTSKIADNNVGTTDLADGSVTSTKIASGAVKPLVDWNEGPEVTIAPGETKSAAALCRTTTAITSGGGAHIFSSTPFPPKARLIGFAPITNSAPPVTGYSISVTNDDSTDISISATAICIDNSP